MHNDAELFATLSHADDLLTSLRTTHAAAMAQPPGGIRYPMESPFFTKEFLDGATAIFAKAKQLAGIERWDSESQFFDYWDEMEVYAETSPATYASAVPRLSTPTLRQVVMTIGAAEARHAALHDVRRAGGTAGYDASGDGMGDFRGLTERLRPVILGELAVVVVGVLAVVVAGAWIGLQAAGALSVLELAAWLAGEGALGRFGIDFVSVRRGDRWESVAIEINLRKGGTTHPFLMLQFLTGGAYDTVPEVMEIIASHADVHAVIYIGIGISYLSWIEQGPTTINSRGSFPSRIRWRARCTRTTTTCSGSSSRP